MPGQYQIIWKDFIILGIIVIGIILGITFLVGPQIPGVSNEIKKFSSYEELKNFVKENLITEYGTFGTATMETMAAKEGVRESAPSAEKSEDYSTTNIQVQGVDEADIVKTDGRYIYTVSGNKIVIADAHPAENAKILSKIELNSPTEIFVNKDKLIVFSQEYPQGVIGQPEIAIKRYYPYSSRTFIKVYDISNREDPLLLRNVSIDGNYYDSRMIGDYVYAVINQPAYYGEPQPIPLPTIASDSEVKEVPASEIYYFDVPDSSYIFTNIISINTQNNDEEIASKTFLLGYTQNMYVSLNNIYIVYTKRISEFYLYDRIIDEIIIPIVSWDVKNKINEIKNSNVSKYEKMQKIGDVFEEYLRSLNPEEGASVMKTAEEKAQKIQQEIAKEMEKTVIHQISITDGKIEYQTNGEVPGNVLNQFSMDEYNGYFRIATTTTPMWGTVTSAQVQTSVTEQIPAETMEQQEKPVEVTPVRVEEPARTVQQPTTQNHVYILDENLKIVGKLEDLAPGERIYSVRFIADKGYMVTFRQIDPLFVIDLSSPENPKVLGYLKIVGVSDYLHPYDENHLIGVGRDATEEGRMLGMKLSLFDVSDVANPKEISKYIIGKRGTDSEALRDHKAFLFSRDKNLLVIPVRVAEEGKYNAFQGAYVFNLDLSNGFVLKGKTTHTEALPETPEKEYYYYDYSREIRRSLYIDNVLYTISQKMIKMNDLENLNEINKIDLTM